jgi:hypothetical protein
MVINGPRAGAALFEAGGAGVEAARSGTDAVDGEDERCDWAADVATPVRTISPVAIAARKRPAMSSPSFRTGFNQTARTEAWIHENIASLLHSRIGAEPACSNAEYEGIND